MSSSPITPITLATVVGLAVGLAGLIDLAGVVSDALRTPSPPVQVAAPAPPSVGVWRVVCPPNGDGWGPYSSPDPCRQRLETAMRTCNHPLLADGHTPNPDFVLIADMCRDAYNATHCRCDFQLVVARTHNPTIDEELFGAR